ncbi:MAG: DNA alkylation repair protein [Dehalococcoidia bacterium]|nr:DNA alkylation repair protein [Dehalococcoidia bacterium]
MASARDVIEELKVKARPDQLDGMARFGIAPEGRLGIAIPELRSMAKKLGKDHELALELWRTGIAEARILASMVDAADKVTGSQMEEWVEDFNSWDICDQVCMNLFDKAPLAWEKVAEWSEREEEFVKRAAFTLIACLAWHDKKSGNEKFVSLLPVIIKGSTDERNFVKKAVNWALRHIGKRNVELNKAAIIAAEQIRKLDSKAARWIASDAIRELQSDAIRRKLKS